MAIDIHTLAFILSITFFLQVTALFVQYRINRSQAGLAWWTLGNASIALGYVFNFLRDNPALGSHAIILNNILFITGLAFICFGVQRYLNRRITFRWLLISGAIFFTVICYFTYLDDNLPVRRVAVSLAAALMSFLISRQLFVPKNHVVAYSASLIAVVFLILGIFFCLRALTPFFNSGDEIFTPSLIQSITYLVTLISSTLWTYGFIILVNQRLNAESMEDKENLELIFNTSPDAVLVTRLTDGLFVSINDGFTSLTGFSRNEVVGKSILEINIWQNPDERQKLVAVLTEAGLCENLEAVFRRKDGSLRTGMVSAKVMTYKGSPHIISVTRDISGRKRAEEALRDSEEKFRKMADMLPQIVFESDMRGNLTYVNKQAFKILGYPEDQPIIGLSSLSFYTSESRARAIENIQRRVSGKSSSESNEYTMVRKDGSTFPALVYSNPVLHDKKPVGLRGIIIDISERMKAETILLKAKQEAENANRSKTIFLANMSHEIRTPLNAIIGFSQLVNRDKHLSNANKEYVKSIILAGEHLLGLINNILELSKLEAGRVVLNSANVDLHALIDDIMLIFNEKTRSKHLQFTIEKANDLPKYVVVDEGRLRQIFINLIGNAIKFTDEGGVSVRAGISKSDKNSTFLRVEISDTGAGISENEIGNLFQQFVQTSSGIKKGSGTGLGLALSSELAVLLGGTITVSSQVGKGSLFTFTVKIEESRVEPEEITDSKRVICIGNDQKKCRILVVDDKRENLRLVVDLLNLVGFETGEAVNGADAVEKFEKLVPDLVIMDMRMPVMNGFEAIRRIRSTEQGRQTPIIALSAGTLDEEGENAGSLGLQGYIRKPFREFELYSVIGKVLGISYICEDDKELRHSKFYTNRAEIAADIAKLPQPILDQMHYALAVADINLLMNLINSIYEHNPDLSELVAVHAKNYDYDYLHQILSERD